MADDQEVVIVDASGTEHVFPPGFNPKHAAAIVRNGGSAALPTKPVSAEDFTKPSEALQQLKDVAIGGVKGLGSSIATIGEMAAAGGRLPGVQSGMLDPTFRHPAFTRAEEVTTATNTPQRIGKVAEQVAELAAPVYQGGKAALTLMGKAGPALGKAGPAVVEVASHLPMVGRPVRMLRMLSRLLTEEAEAASNAGGRLVTGQSPKIEQVVSDALNDLRAPTPPARITTPPEPNLPAGFTPRATVPRPKAVVTPKPVAPTTEPAAPKRAYFLKPLEEMATKSEPVAPTGRPVTVEDLPASWRSRVDQPVIPSQGKAGAALGSDALAELQRRGLSLQDAIEAVAKNPSLSPSARLSLQSALIAMLGGEQ